MISVLRHLAARITGRLLSKEESQIREILASDVFDERWYRATYPDIEGADCEAVVHYYFQGSSEKRNPCFLFDTQWYLKQNPDVATSDMIPLVHYLLFGEAEGRKPSPLFSPTHYRKQLGPAVNPPSLLGHYLHEGSRKHSPNSYFDTKFYLSNNPQLVSAGMHPLAHYLERGWREGLEISPRFSFVRYGRTVYNSLGLEKNPLSHFLENGHDEGDFLPVTNTYSPDDAARNTLALIADSHQSGEAFEELDSTSSVFPEEMRARVFAFYLPQFHPIEENDRWWGAGFTEWRNVTRALPRFVGHQQPRLPRDLGFYDLRNPDTLRRQIELAKAALISGFAFYFYWFNGKRLLDQPIEIFLEKTDLEFPFFLIWANENWTRRWDGFDDDVLIQQDYDEADDEALVDEFCRHFSDPRYERIDGRPLLVIYRPGIIADCEKRIQAWRELFLSRHAEEPLILMAQGFGDTDPRAFGLDGAVEFPPHKLAQGLPLCNSELDVIDPDFTGHYMSYDDLIKRSLNEQPCTEFPVIRTAAPCWDNEARKPGRGMGFVGATPDRYEFWMRELARNAMQSPFLGKAPYVFVNAWNEWAEGAFLEPDIRYGSAYLNATRRAVGGAELPNSTPSGTRVLLVGHDAHPHGAQLLTLNIARTLVRTFGCHVRVLLLDGGPLLPAYEEVCPTLVADNSVDFIHKSLSKLIKEFKPTFSICNTVVTGSLVAELARMNLPVVSLIHEMRELITDRGFELQAAATASSADALVFASRHVEASFRSVVGEIRAPTHIRPQGIYQKVSRQPSQRAHLRQRLGLPESARFVINLGYADHRKGFDLFVGLSDELARIDPDVHCVWIGNLDARLSGPLLETRTRPNLYLLPFDTEITPYINGADVFALTSREDPFPSVVLEALACGVPVVAFEGGGGYVEAIADKQDGATCRMEDVGALAKTTIEFIRTDSESARTARAERASSRYLWRDYVFDLMKFAKPDLQKVSVVVPNYNYAHHIGQRLRSIFEQSYPIFELIVLDDASTDESVEVIKHTAGASRRDIDLIVSDDNSGNVFKQWEKGVSLCRGDLIWIAEADDSAEPEFVQKLAARFGPDTAMVFSDSSQIDETGRKLGDSYQFYYRDLEDPIFDTDFDLPGTEFIERALSVKNTILNVSSVIFSRDAIKQVLDDYSAQIKSMKVAGDWICYIHILARTGARIGYVNEGLNVHRRHSQSVTHALDVERHIREIGDSQGLASSTVSSSAARRERAADYLDSVRTRFANQSTGGR